jgi:hypothetical protein
VRRQIRPNEGQFIVQEHILIGEAALFIPDIVIFGADVWTSVSCCIDQSIPDSSFQRSKPTTGGRLLDAVLLWLYRQQTTNGAAFYEVNMPKSHVELLD